MSRPTAQSFGSLRSKAKLTGQSRPLDQPSPPLMLAQLPVDVLARWQGALPASWWGEAMADPVSLMLDDLTSRYAETLASETFARLYTDDSQFGHVFATSTND